MVVFSAYTDSPVEGVLVGASGGKGVPSGHALGNRLQFASPDVFHLAIQAMGWKAVEEGWFSSLVKSLVSGGLLSSQPPLGEVGVEMCHEGNGGGECGYVGHCSGGVCSGDKQPLLHGRHARRAGWPL